MPPFADVLQWEHLPFPKSLKDFQRLFPTDEACARYLEGAKLREQCVDESQTLKGTNYEQQRRP